jgi:hypothetical protein
MEIILLNYKNVHKDMKNKFGIIIMMYIERNFIFDKNKIFLLDKTNETC